MSISAKNTAPDDDDFADIEFRPRPVTSTPVPADETPAKQVEPLTPPEPAESTQEPSETADSTPAKPEPTDKQGEPKKKKNGKRGFFSVFFDVILVMLLLGVLVGGGYYIKLKMDVYSVPSAIELAMQENARLQRERQDLIDAYYQADENILMRESLARLDSEMAKVQAECAEIESSIAEQKDKIMALQYEIRSTDKEYRSIALSLLPGMAIGDAVTTRGRGLREAYIYRLEGKLITLRSHEGQIRVPTRELIKKDMPKLARYAFGEIDLVNMSDFESAGDAPSAKDEKSDKEQAESPAQARVTVRTGYDYEPTGGSPVVDTSAGATITAPTTATHRTTEEWIPTEGELPF